MDWVDADAYRGGEIDAVLPHRHGIAAHMNDDHADAGILLCEQALGTPVTSATFRHVDRFGCEYVAASAPTSRSCGWRSPPGRSNEDVRRSSSSWCRRRAGRDAPDRRGHPRGRRRRVRWRRRCTSPARPRRRRPSRPRRRSGSSPSTATSPRSSTRSGSATRSSPPTSRRPVHRGRGDPQDRVPTHARRRDDPVVLADRRPRRRPGRPCRGARPARVGRRTRRPPGDSAASLAFEDQYLFGLGPRTGALVADLVTAFHRERTTSPTSSP